MGVEGGPGSVQWGVRWSRGPYQRAIGSLIGVVVPRSPPAWSQRIGARTWRRSQAVWLMMCRSCSGSAATSARSRARSLDHNHAGAAVRAWAGQHTRRVRCDIRLLSRLDSRRVGAEQCAGRCDALGAVGAGQEPVVADAMEAPGQYVQQESPDELMRMQPHRLPARRAVGAVVLPAERDAGVVGCNEAAIEMATRWV